MLGDALKEVSGCVSVIVALGLKEGTNLLAAKFPPG